MTKTTKKPKQVKKTLSKRLNSKTIKLIILIVLSISLIGITAYSLKIFSPSTPQDTSETPPAEEDAATDSPQEEPAPSTTPESEKNPSSPNQVDLNAQKLALCKEIDNAASKILVATIQASQKDVDAKINDLMIQMSNGTIDWYQFKQQRSAYLSEANVGLDSAYNNYVKTVKDKGCEPTHVPPGHYS